MKLESSLIYGVVKNMASGAPILLAQSSPLHLWQAGVPHQWPNDIHKKRFLILEMKIENETLYVQYSLIGTVH